LKQALLGILAVVLLPACVISPIPTTESPDYPAAYQLPIQDYLVEHIGQSSFGGKVFCTYDMLGADLLSDGADVYVWALCAEYYLVGEIPTMGTASSLPVALHMQVSGGKYRVIGNKVPMDGMEYGTSIQLIFPKETIKKMCRSNADCYNERAERLENLARQQAMKYFALP
jgi:hypothetical protein